MDRRCKAFALCLLMVLCLVHEGFSECRDIGLFDYPCEILEQEHMKEHSESLCVRNIGLIERCCRFCTDLGFNPEGNTP